MTDFGAAVRAVRRSRHVTQAELAAAAGMSREALVRVERGQVSPGPGTYQRLVGALGFVYGVDLMAAAGELL
ncbi:MAG: helix-turn-helix domain-containing protein [Chloroflexota bacterium]|nr:helix-turn-helix domain-containing protein [Chloroflexota bacterium]